MERRKYTREFKLETVNMMKGRGVSLAQAARDLDIRHTVLRRWVKEFGADPQHAFPGVGQMKPEQLEIDRLRKEVARLKAERDILKKAAVGSTGQCNNAVQLISRCQKAKCFSWAGIEVERHLIKIVLIVS